MTKRMPRFVYYPAAGRAYRVTSNRYRGSDAGTAPRTGDPFIVLAETPEAAKDAAERWLACWRDEGQQCVPDDLSMVELSHGTMALQVN